MKTIMMTKSKDNKHIYVYDKKSDIVKSYQLIKHIPNCHYIYVLSHTFMHPIEGMFGDEQIIKDKVEDLGHNMLYVHKPRQRRLDEKQSSRKSFNT